jgi:hypothetical protein
MSNPILSLYQLESPGGAGGELPFSGLATRDQNLTGLSDNPNVDLVIIGGGLTGALVAWEAALRDIRVVLVERGICGEQAVSWSTRIAQLLRINPLRVAAGSLSLRELSKVIAPHLVSAAPRDTHVTRGWRVSLANRLVPSYDVDERLLIREIILAARQEGALVFQASEATYVEAESESGCYVLGLRDHVGERKVELRVGGIVIDPSHGYLPPTRLGSKVLQVADPVTAGVQRIYRVTPKTTRSGERFASFELSDGAFMSTRLIADEIVEVHVLFGTKALPPAVLDVVCPEAVGESGWVVEEELSSRGIDGRWSAHYRVQQARGIFTCSHRAPWEAFRSARRIVKRALSCSNEPRPFAKLPRRPLPGEEQGCEVDTFRAQARSRGVSERTIELCVKRWRGRVRHISQFVDGFQELCPGVLAGEIDLAYRSDQATSVEDIVVGALVLPQCPGWQNSIPVIADRFRQLARG